MNLYQTQWYVTTLLLCTYGSLKEFRPTVPFHHHYQHDALNISKNILDVDAHPILTYTWMLALIPVFLLVDLLLYKPLIILEALTYIAAWVILVFSNSARSKQAIESLYGWAAAAEIAYFAYAYATVSREKFRMVTSFTRGALLLGRFLAFSLAQLFILLQMGKYHTFKVISVVVLCISLFFASILPPVSWKRTYEDKLLLLELKPKKTLDGRHSFRDLAKLHIKAILRDIRIIYANKITMMWSISWAMANCAYSQVENCARMLWKLKAAEHPQIYDGIVNMSCSLTGLLVVLVVLYVPVDWSHFGQLFIGVHSLSNALVLLLISHTNSLLIIYFGYGAYSVMYQALITITQFNLVDGADMTSCGFVFGLNSFVGLAFQSILTIVIASLFDLSTVTRPQVRANCAFSSAMSNVST
ncbi:hypothetical protein Y032_0211g2188 [Ancylostoma ceylanicum]|uniref:Reduced folate carrier n=1 Tax=Ancylostoma ceylanicum TaxID=53326 RepID=A0A016SK53_9BILA|nr:hypothetical protein Y032_0211g2188 [Ancylostoma ceylanicum]